MLSGLDHITVVVAEVPAAVERFTALLGFGPTWRGRHAELGTRAALFGLGNTLIELVAPDGDAAESTGLRELLATRGEGIQSIAFSADSIDACFAQLRERGLRVTPPQQGEAMGDDGVPRSYQALELSPRITRQLSLYVVARADSNALRRGGSQARDAVQALDHLVVLTGDPHAAKALYGTALGLRLALEKEVFGARMLFFRIGGVTLEVVTDTGLSNADEFYGIAFRVADIDSARDRLVRERFDVSETRSGRKPGTRVFTMRGGVCGVPILVIADPSRHSA